MSSNNLSPLIVLLLTFAVVAVDVSARGILVPSATNAPYQPDEPLLYNAAKFASAAYCKPSEGIANWTCSRCNISKDIELLEFFDTKTLNTTDLMAATKFIVLQGYVVAAPSMELIVVAFRGTVSSSLKDWIYDFDITKAKVSKYWDIPKDCVQDMEAHKGFLDAYEALRAGVMSGVTKGLAKYPNYRILVTGHSLGASLAILSALDLAVSFPQNAHMIRHGTFGEPRTGTRDFASCVNITLPGQTTRMTHHKDPVPMIPQEFLGFYHVNHEVYLPNTVDTNFDGAIVCDGSGEDKKGIDRYDLLQAVIDDHYHYLGVLLESGC